MPKSLLFIAAAFLLATAAGCAPGEMWMLSYPTTTGFFYDGYDEPMEEANIEAAETVGSAMWHFENQNFTVYVPPARQKHHPTAHPDFGQVCAEQLVKGLYDDGYNATLGIPPAEPGLFDTTAAIAAANATDPEDAPRYPHYDLILVTDYEIGVSSVRMRAELRNVKDDQLLVLHQWDLQNNRTTQALIPELRTQGMNPNVYTSFQSERHLRKQAKQAPKAKPQEEASVESLFAPEESEMNILMQ